MRPLHAHLHEVLPNLLPEVRHLPASAPAAHNRPIGPQPANEWWTHRHLMPVLPMRLRELPRGCCQFLYIPGQTSSSPTPYPLPLRPMLNACLYPLPLPLPLPQPLLIGSTLYLHMAPQPPAPSRRLGGSERWKAWALGIHPRAPD